jgi:hypothetical protein
MIIRISKIMGVFCSKLGDGDFDLGQNDPLDHLSNEREQRKEKAKKIQNAHKKERKSRFEEVRKKAKKIQNAHKKEMKSKFEEVRKKAEKRQNANKQKIKKHFKEVRQKYKVVKEERQKTKGTISLHP